MALNPVFQRLRNVIFGSAFTGFHAIKSTSLPPKTLLEVAIAFGSALVKGVANTDNCLMRADGVDGAIQKSSVIVTDAGSMDIPTGQHYSIGGANVTEVTKVLAPKYGVVAPTDVTPEYIGQIYVNTVSLKFYISKSIVAGEWVEVTK